MLFIDTLIDGSLLAVLLAVWSIEDFSGVIKMVTSLIVSALSLVRWYYFFKNKNRDYKNDKRNSKNT